MKHFEAILLALGALVLSAVASVTAQEMRGMIWTNDDNAKPIAMQGAACPGFVIASGLFQQTDHGVLEGYFAVGPSFDGMVRPNDPKFSQLRDLREKSVDVIIRVHEPTRLEVIK